MNKDIHPIELMIVAFLLLFEGLCWVINELAGFHTTKSCTYQETIKEELPQLPSGSPFVSDLSNLMKQSKTNRTTSLKRSRRNSTMIPKTIVREKRANLGFA